MLPASIQAQRTSRLLATVDLVIVLVVFALGSLSVPFVNPILRNGPATQEKEADILHLEFYPAPAPDKIPTIRHRPT